MEPTTWQRALKEAIDETDSAKLSSKVMTAETAMFSRIIEVGSEMSDDEREAMKQAAKELRKIQIERLHWPKTGFDQEIK
jgi:uncharacterized tellurite resistance protein B-like protein